MSKKLKIIIAIVAILAVAAFIYMFVIIPKSKRNALIAWGQPPTNSPSEFERWKGVVNAMSNAEVNAAHNFLFNYFEKKIEPPVELQQQIAVIKTKYNVLG